MKQRAYLQLDVFARARGCGNPLGVVLDAEDLDASSMQAIAAWLNLSETTFVLRPTQAGADYRLRIDGDGGQRRLHVRAPQGVEREGDPATVMSSLRGAARGTLRPALIDNGPRWWCIELADEADVRTLSPDLAAMSTASVATGTVGVAVFARCRNQSYALAVRAFVPADGIPEDPVTGSANAAIAAWMHANDALPARSYLASQGREVGRDGIVECAVEAAGDVWIGGQTQTVVAGTLAW